MFRLYYILLFLESYAFGSVTVFHGSPATTVQGLTQYVRLRCSLNDTAASANLIGRRDTTTTTGNVEQVSSIIIMHNSIDIASVAQSHPAKSMVAASNMDVSGDVSGKTGERGFLELKFQYPLPTQLGEFECEIVATNPNGHGTIFNVYTATNVTQPTLIDIVKEMKLSRTTDQQCCMTQSQHTYITSLHNKNTALENTVSSLQHSLSSLQTQVNSLQAAVAFTNPQVRLFGGNKNTNGAVEVIYNGATGFLCDDKFDQNNNGARVVCRMLGFSDGVYIDGNAYAATFNRRYLLDEVVCTGHESSLDHCSHAAWGVNDCSTTEIAGVNCS